MATHHLTKPTTMEITLYAPVSNRRRAYGVEFRINGISAPESGITLKPGDKVTWRYLGGNVGQSPNAPAWRELGYAGIINPKADSGEFTMP